MSDNELRRWIAHYWEIGCGIDQTIRQLATHRKVRVGFHDVQPVFARLSAEWAGTR